MKSIYTEPKITKYDNLDRSWFVYFRYNKKLFRYKAGINYYKNLKDRTKEAEALREALSNKLKSGWNPNIPEDIVIGQNKNLTFSEAMDFALEKKKITVSTNTYYCYSSMVNFCKKAIKNLKFDNILVSEIKRTHIKIVLERMKENMQWSNCAYNQNLVRLQVLISELVEWEFIEFNPAYKIKKLKFAESKANTPPNPDQHKQIKEKLETEYPDFYFFVIMIFHTGIRPEEILKIKLSMVDLENRQIVLPPNIQKTRIKERVVPINSHLLKYFEAIDLDKFPSDYYLFGNTGKRFEKKYLYLAPSSKKINRTSITKRWKEIVKDGLGIPVNMYAMKHFGADQKILAGIDLDALRELYGHGSKLMTMKYAKAVKEVYRKEIMDKSPEF